MSVIPKDPLGWLMLFRQQMNEIFTFLSGLERPDQLGEREFTPLLDIYETADNYCIEIELPGFPLSELRLTICCNTLVIEGQKGKECGGQGSQTYICLERHFGRFCRALEIPPACDREGAEARYDKGVLLVTFPLKRERTAIVRTIPIQQGD